MHAFFHSFFFFFREGLDDGDETHVTPQNCSPSLVPRFEINQRAAYVTQLV